MIFHACKSKEPSKLWKNVTGNPYYTVGLMKLIFYFHIVGLADIYSSRL